MYTIQKIYFNSNKYKICKKILNRYMILINFMKNAYMAIDLELK